MRAIAYLLGVLCYMSGVARSQRPPQCAPGRACQDPTSVEAATDFRYNVTGKDKELVVSLADGKFSLDCQGQRVSDVELPSFVHPTSFHKVVLRHCYAGDVAATLGALNVTSTRLSLEQCEDVHVKGLRGYTMLQITEAADVFASEIYEMNVTSVKLYNVTLREAHVGLGEALLKLEVAHVRGAQDIALANGLRVLRAKGHLPQLGGVARTLTKLYVEAVAELALPHMPMLEELDVVNVKRVSGAATAARLRRVMLVGTPPWSDANGLREYAVVSASLRAVPPLATSLTNLSLARNAITEWPPMAHHMPNLTNIDLSRNRIAHLSAALLPPSLRTINLAYNKITKLTERELAFSSGCVDVDLTGNNITDIECERCGSAGIRVTLDSVLHCGRGAKRARAAGVMFIGGRCAGSGAALGELSPDDTCPALCVCREHEMRCPNAGLAEWPPLPPGLQRLLLPGNNLTYIPLLPPTLISLDLSANPLEPNAANALRTFSGDASITCRCDALLERLADMEGIHCHGEADVRKKMMACRAERGGAVAGVGAAVAGALLAVASALVFYYACRKRVKRALAVRLCREDWSLPLDATVWAPAEESAWCREICRALRERGLKVQCGAEEAAGEYLPAKVGEGIRGARRTLLLSGGTEGAEGLARRRAKECELHRVIEIRRAGSPNGSHYTCLFDDDPHFWQKLMKAMPTHSSNNERIFTIT